MGELIYLNRHSKTGHKDAWVDLHVVSSKDAQPNELITLKEFATFGTDEQGTEVCAFKGPANIQLQAIRGLLDNLDVNKGGRELQSLIKTELNQVYGEVKRKLELLSDWSI